MSSSNEPYTQTRTMFRYWIVLLTLQTLSIFICYADRSNISTAIIPMSEQYGWDSSLQGLILSSFFYGYVATQLLGGWLSDKFGGKNVLTVGVLVWSLSTLGTPIAADMGASGLVLTRIILGLGEGVAFPAIHSMISRSVPERAQSSAVAIFTSSSYLGVAVAFYLSPVIIDQLGWEWVFYIFGLGALAWLPLWLPQKIKSPTYQQLDNKKVDEELDKYTDTDPSDENFEQTTLVNSSQSSSRASGSSVPRNIFCIGKSNKPGSKTNWSLFKRKEVWAICVAQFTQSWGMYGLLNWLPTFFKEQYGVDISDLGIYTFLPYLAQASMGGIAGFIADGMIARGHSVRYVRTLIQSISMIGPATCLLLSVTPASTSNTELASWFVTIGTGLSALSVAGVSVSQLDIAPRNSGLVFAFGNTFATAAGLLSVQITGVLLQEFDSWVLVFGITSGMYLIGAVFWGMWVGGERLPEDQPDYQQ